ncbi:hypothetical protein GCM10018980_77610 [Streptomyces capoamus]|uniref:Uncharacterized protein n=1 Tax=Streptomyces capoamus TaxID=68183 RepID=A0A919F513_9ACTN|nr:hypothetical protein [Streptomyces capoamus]GGW13280.1 hypothetical protein GCM10010501_16210 [Streptomyces libani subsp. rufus]GHG79943.1 hypothetical protein GCM10018980_77610 [Streptomyces capoamus]
MVGGDADRFVIGGPPNRVWDLTSDSGRLARRLLAEEHLTLLVPLRQGTDRPAWLQPAVKDNWVLL